MLTLTMMPMDPTTRYITVAGVAPVFRPTTWWIPAPLARQKPSTSVVCSHLPWSCSSPAVPALPVSQQCSHPAATSDHHMIPRGRTPVEAAGEQEEQLEEDMSDGEWVWPAVDVQQAVKPYLGGGMETFTLAEGGQVESRLETATVTSANGVEFEHHLLALRVHPARQWNEDEAAKEFEELGLHYCGTLAPRGAMPDHRVVLTIALEQTLDAFAEGSVLNRTSTVRRSAVGRSASRLGDHQRAWKDHLVTQLDLTETAGGMVAVQAVVPVHEREEGAMRLVCHLADYTGEEAAFLRFEQIAKNNLEKVHQLLQEGRGHSTGAWFDPVTLKRVTYSTPGARHLSSLLCERDGLTLQPYAPPFSKGKLRSAIEITSRTAPQSTALEEALKTEVSRKALELNETKQYAAAKDAHRRLLKQLEEVMKKPEPTEPTAKAQLHAERETLTKRVETRKAEVEAKLPKRAQPHWQRPDSNKHAKSEKVEEAFAAEGLHIVTQVHVESAVLAAAVGKVSGVLPKAGPATRKVMHEGARLYIHKLHIGGNTQNEREEARDRIASKGLEITTRQPLNASTRGGLSADEVVMYEGAEHCFETRVIGADWIFAEWPEPPTGADPQVMRIADPQWGKFYREGQKWWPRANSESAARATWRVGAKKLDKAFEEVTSGQASKAAELGGGIIQAHAEAMSITKAKQAADAITSVSARVSFSPHTCFLTCTSPLCPSVLESHSPPTLASLYAHLPHAAPPPTGTTMHPPSLPPPSSLVPPAPPHQPIACYPAEHGITREEGARDQPAQGESHARICAGEASRMASDQGSRRGRHRRRRLPHRSAGPVHDDPRCIQRHPRGADHAAKAGCCRRKDLVQCALQGGWGVRDPHQAREQGQRVHQTHLHRRLRGGGGNACDPGPIVPGAPTAARRVTQQKGTDMNQARRPDGGEEETPNRNHE